MRKIVAGLFILLDGVVELPEKWAFTYLNDEVSKGIAAGIAQADVVLLGRRTYQQFAKIWPSQGSKVPMARFLNRSPVLTYTQPMAFRIRALKVWLVPEKAWPKYLCAAPQLASQTP